jgi:hypothetical protein
MRYFGMRLMDILGFAGSEPLPEAVLKASDRLRFIVRALGSGDGGDNGGTDPDIPTPVAS